MIKRVKRLGQVALLSAILTVPAIGGCFLGVDNYDHFVYGGCPFLVWDSWDVLLLYSPPGTEFHVLALGSCITGIQVCSEWTGDDVNCSPYIGSIFDSTNGGSVTLSCDTKPGEGSRYEVACPEPLTSPADGSDSGKPQKEPREIGAFHCLNECLTSRKTCG